MPDTLYSAAIASTVLNRLDLETLKRYLEHLTADDLIKVQAAAQELADLAWKELEKR